MEIEFFRQQAMENLRASIPDNIHLYATSSDPWIEKYFISQDISLPIVSSGIEIPEIDLLVGGESTNDGPNAVTLHKALKGILNPVQASDRRVWTAMAHSNFYEYMTKRWPVKEELNENNTNGTVTDRYFMARGLLRNGISRLYWFAEMTYDETLEDPYEYTKYLLSNQDLMNQVDGQAYCRNKSTLQVVLKTLKEAGKLSESQNRSFFERLCKRGGTIMLDALPKEALSELCNSTLKSSMQISRVYDGCTMTLKSVTSNTVMQVTVQKGKAYLGKSMVKSNPNNLNKLSVGKDLIISGVKYRIVSIA